MIGCFAFSWNHLPAFYLDYLEADVLLLVETTYPHFILIIWKQKRLLGYFHELTTSRWKGPTRKWDSWRKQSAVSATNHGEYIVEFSWHHLMDWSLGIFRKSILPWDERSTFVSLGPPYKPPTGWFQICPPAMIPSDPSDQRPEPCCKELCGSGLAGQHLPLWRRPLLRIRCCRSGP